MPLNLHHRLARPLTAVAATALGISLLGACSTDSLAEFGLEQVLSAEGQDVDIDFSDGGINLSGEDGDFSLSFDAEDGIIEFGGDDGSGVIQFDEDGNVRFDTDQGSGTATITDNGVSFQGDNDEGEFSFVTDDESGAQVFTSEEGQVSISTNVPADWPDWIGVPETLLPTESTFSVSKGDGYESYTGFVSHDPSENYAGAVNARLESVGFTMTGSATDLSGPNTGYVQWANGDTEAMVTYEAGFTMVFVSNG